MSENYDAGLLSDYGGGNVEWWQDYLRAEIDRANEYHNEIHSYNEGRIEELKVALKPFISGSDWGVVKAALVAAGNSSIAKALSENQAKADGTFYEIPY